MSQPKNNYNNKENTSQLSQHKKNNYKENYGTNIENINPVLNFLNELYNNKYDDLAKKFCRINKRFESEVINITSNINRLKTSNLKSPFNFQYKNNKENYIKEFNNKSKAREFIIKEYTKILNNLLKEIDGICNFIQNNKFNDLRDQIRISFNILNEKDVDLNNQLFSSFEKEVVNINKQSQDIVMFHNQTDRIKLLKGGEKDVNRNCTDGGKNFVDYTLTTLACIVTVGGYGVYRWYTNKPLLIHT